VVKGLKSDELEPEWVKNEREIFQKFRDKNGDNVLDREEVANWMMPPDFDHTLNEAKHLIYETDKNNVIKLNVKFLLNSKSNISVFL
jgi:Ca2+-binding EF-hand superfamily protein